MAAVCEGQNIIAVSDAYRLFPKADILYSCDAKWWDIHEGCPSFAGEKWSSHDDETNKKLEAAERHDLNLVRGEDREGFSLDPSCIHYGSNSGFQAINLAILLGAKKIILVGFDMTATGSPVTHFFGDHPKGLIHNRDYERFIPQFNAAAKRLPKDIKIINCTRDSALKCFPMMELADALSLAA